MPRSPAAWSEVRVGFDGRPRAPFLGREPGERPGGHDPPREAHAVHRDPLVLGGGEVVQADRGVGEGIRARDAHVAAARRPQVAHRRRDRRKRMQRLAELVERERLHVPLDVRASAAPGSLFAKAPSCEGGIVSGPVRKRRYSSPMSRLARSGCWRARSAWRRSGPCTPCGSAGGRAGSRRRRAGRGRPGCRAPGAARRGRRRRAAGAAASRSRPRRARPRGARRHPRRRAVRAADLDARRAPGAVAALDDHPRDVRVGEDGQVRPMLDAGGGRPRPVASARRGAGSSGSRRCRSCRRG